MNDSDAQPASHFQAVLRQARPSLNQPASSGKNMEASEEDARCPKRSRGSGSCGRGWSGGGGVDNFQAGFWWETGHASIIANHRITIIKVEEP